MKLIKKQKSQDDNFKVGQIVLAGRIVPEQNIGMGIEYVPAKIVKINRVSLNVETSNGNIYQVNKKMVKVG